MPSFTSRSCEQEDYPVLTNVSVSYPELTGRLPTCYSPIRRSFHRSHPEGIVLLPALDLHVLGTPPAFVLSQDQTLHRKLVDCQVDRRRQRRSCTCAGKCARHLNCHKRLAN